MLPARSFNGSIPASWSSLWQLTYLSLQGNLLTGTLPAAWGALTNLTQLNLGCGCAWVAMCFARYTLMFGLLLQEYRFFIR